MTTATELSAERRPHPNLVVSDTEQVRVIRIDREDKLGALSGSLVTALGEQAAEVRQRPDIRVVVLTGTGRSFIAGADIGEYSQAGPEVFAEYQRRSRAVFGAFEQLPQPTIAAINGFAFGGGFELALCCDFIVAADNSKFSLPEVRLGLIPGGGGTQRLARAAGARWTKEIVMTGRVVTAEEAHRKGIATQVSSRDGLMDAAMELARTLARNAPLAVREAKRVVDDGLAQELSAALTAEQAALSRLFESADGQEGIAAFLAKRDPDFRGHRS